MTPNFDDAFKVDLTYTESINVQFRTITTMLRALQCTQDVSGPGEDGAETGDLESQRQILTALATLLVRNREVVTVALGSEPIPTRITLVVVEQSSDLHTNKTPIEHIAIQNNKPVDTGMDTAPLKRVSFEYPDGSLVPCHKAPITLAEALYYVHLNKSPVEGERATLTFAHHANLVVQLILANYEPKDTRVLWTYIIGMSHQKMLRRLDHPFSKNALEQLRNVSFSQSSQPPNGHAKYPHLTATDSHLLKSLIPLDLDYSRYPNLTLDCGTRTLEVGVSPPLYHQAGGEDFRHLLLELLGRYDAALRALRRYETRPVVEQGAASTPMKRRLKQLNRLIYQVQIYGNALYSMVNSTAMTEHLASTTFPTLNYPNFSPRLAGTKTQPSDDDITDDDDADFVDILPGLCQPIIRIGRGTLTSNARSYQKWLRLIVGYFRSESYLLSYLKKQEPALSLHILSIPPQSTKMLTWQQLLEVYPKLPREAEIRQVINHFPQISTFFEDGGALTTGVHLGTVHCQAVLASFYYNSRHQQQPEVPEPIDATMAGIFEVAFPSYLLIVHGADTITKEMAPIIGVSKRCCIVCEELSSILYFRGKKEELHQPSSHQRVHPCSLPQWLPKGIVDRMLQVFKNMLMGVLNRTITITKRSHNSQEDSVSLIDAGNRNPDVGSRMEIDNSDLSTQTTQTTGI